MKNYGITLTRGNYATLGRQSHLYHLILFVHQSLLKVVPIVEGLAWMEGYLNLRNAVSPNLFAYTIQARSRSYESSCLLIVGTELFIAGLGTTASFISR